MLDDEVFVGEHAAVDGLAALPVAVRKVAALHHEVLHHAVEHRPVVVKRLPYKYNNFETKCWQCCGSNINLNPNYQ